MSSANDLRGVDIEVIRKGPSLSHEEYVDLVSSVSTKEIDEPFSSINSHKAQGIDDFSFFSYNRA